MHLHLREVVIIAELVRLLVLRVREVHLRKIVLCVMALEDAKLAVVMGIYIAVPHKKRTEIVINVMPVGVVPIVMGRENKNNNFIDT